MTKPMTKLMNQPDEPTDLANLMNQPDENIDWRTDQQINLKTIYDSFFNRVFNTIIIFYLVLKNGHPS